MSPAPVHALLACLLFTAPGVAKGSNTLRSSVRGVSARGGGFLTAHDVEDVLLGELAGALRHHRGGSVRGGAESNLDAIEATLGPMFAALPKNEHGNLGHATARYALHRLFVQRHGWFVKGLEPQASAGDGPAPAEILKNRVPAYVQELFESRLGTRGLGMRELAVLAATLEHLVHDEMIERLKASYEVLGASHQQQVDLAQADEILDTYMAGYISGSDMAGLSPANASAMRASVQQHYLGWMDTQLWVRDVRRSVAHAGHSSPFSTETMRFSDTAHVIEAMNDQYGHFQDRECRSLKELLVDFEDGDRGRVRLSEFYRAQLSGLVPPAFQLSETADTLRHLGALDESDPRRPSVIVQNYLLAPSNCLASSSLYTVCCIDECESLLGHLERNLAAPHAPAETIARLVAGLPSDTVEAPRNLSAPLLRRLDEIAAAHGGEVPLHGRLFAQWMHHAYPRECPYPHESSQRSASVEAAAQAGVRTMTASEMQQQAQVSADEEADVETSLPWTMREELLVQPRAPGWNAGQLFQAALLASVALSLGRTFLSSWKTVHKDDAKKPSAGLPWHSRAEGIDKYA